MLLGRINLFVVEHFPLPVFMKQLGIDFLEPHAGPALVCFVYDNTEWRRVFELTALHVMDP